MALDTRDKRASAIGSSLAVPSVLPNADGAINQGDRQQCAYCYRGVESGEPPVSASGGNRLLKGVGE